MRKIALIFCFLISLFGCESYTWQVGQTPEYPKTYVKDFVKDDGFLFPSGSSVYDFITCFNLGSRNNSEIQTEGDFSRIKVSYFVEGNAETRVLQFDNETMSLTFIFDKDKGVVRDDKTHEAIFLVRK